VKVERLLPDWIASWKEYMSNSEAPAIYNEWVGVSMVASVLERKTYLTWDKRVYPNFYIVLVGPPGCRKGTAMTPGRTLLEEATVNIAADATTKEKLASRLQEASDNFTAMDGQVHGYAAMTIYSEEFTVFLGYGNIELMQWMSDWYDCKDIWKYETKHQGVNEVAGVWVNLIGATTPELLQESLPRESFGGGLNSRIIYVYANKKDKLVLFPFLKPGQEKHKHSLMRDLQLIRLTNGEFKPDESYLKCWEDWYPHQHGNAMNDDKMAGYQERRPTHLHKIAMVMNASRNADGMILTKTDFTMALDLLTRTEANMQRTFAGVGKSLMAVTMNRILKQLKYINYKIDLNMMQMRGS